MCIRDRFTSDGDLHRRQRRLIKPAFYPERVRGYGNLMLDCAKQETDSWKDASEIDIGRAMSRITLSVITKSMFGTGLENHVSEQVYTHLTEVFSLMNR